MKHIALVVLALVLAAGAALYFARDRIALALFETAVQRGLAANAIAELPNGLSAGFCGTGAPLPDRARAGPCLAIVAGERLFVFDAGDGSAETLALMGLPPARVEAVFLTHFHSDHIDGLGNLALQRWAGGSRDTQLPLHGGPGVERVAAGFNEAYAIDSAYRVAHHGADVVPPSGFGLVAQPFAIAEGQDHTTVLDDGGVRIVAFRVTHGPVEPAYGYRVEYADRSIVISGDTSASAVLTREAHGADLLVHEALQPRLVGVMEDAAREQGQENVAHILHDILDYHTAPEAAADIAQQADVGALALTHILPPLPVSLLHGPFLGDARQRFDGPVWVMRDGDLIILPAEGGIQRRNTLR